MVGIMKYHFEAFIQVGITKGFIVGLQKEKNGERHFCHLYRNDRCRLSEWTRMSYDDHEGATITTIFENFKEGRQYGWVKL